MSENTTFTLACSNSAGSDTATVKITTTAAPVAPSIESLSASPQTVTSGKATNVTWTWTYANTPTPAPTCTIDHGVGTITSGTATSVTLSENTTFTLACSNSAGSDTATVKITTTAAPVAPSIESLSASPQTVTSGKATNVTWTWTYANTPTPAPTCTIDHGVGTITSGTATSVTLSKNTTFTLVCSNSAGSDTATVKITTTPVVPKLPPIKWRVSLHTGTKDKSGNVVGGTEIRSLAVFDGKVFAGNGYWTDTQGNPGPQVLVLDRPKSKGGQWRQDLRLHKSRHLLVNTMKAVTLATDAQGAPLATPEHLLLAAGGWNSNPVTTYVRRVSGVWTETTIRPGTCRASARSLGLHRDSVTGADMVFAGVHGQCPTNIYGAVFEASKPGRIRWLGAETWADSPGGDDRVTSFAVVNGKLHATVCGKIFQRTDGPNPSWRKVYQHPQDACLPGPGETGFRGLTAIPNGGGTQSMIAGLENKGLLTRLSPRGGAFDYTLELNARTYLRAQWGISSVGYTILAYDGMLSTTLPAGGGPVLMIGLEARVNGGATWHGWARGAWFLARFSDGSYQLAEVVDPT